jgi:hypothetical protein
MMRGNRHEKQHEELYAPMFYSANPEAGVDNTVET